MSHDEYRVKWELLRDAMRFGRTEEALVRIVVPLGPGSAGAQGGAARADSIAHAVAVGLIPRVRQALPSWRSGGPST